MSPLHMCVLNEKSPVQKTHARTLISDSGEIRESGTKANASTDCTEITEARGAQVQVLHGPLHKTLEKFLKGLGL